HRPARRTLPEGVDGGGDREQRGDGREGPEEAEKAPVVGRIPREELRGRERAPVGDEDEALGEHGADEESQRRRREPARDAPYDHRLTGVGPWALGLGPFARYVDRPGTPTPSRSAR